MAQNNNNHNVIKMNTVNNCMIQFYHEENEALHKALAIAVQQKEELHHNNEGLRNQRDYNARLAQQANIRAQALESAYDKAERFALYQEFILQETLPHLANLFQRETVGNHPEYDGLNINRDIFKWHIHRIYASFYPNGEAPEITLPEPVPMEIEEDEETDSETEDEGLADDEMTDSDMEVEL